MSSHSKNLCLRIHSSSPDSRNYLPLNPRNEILTSYTMVFLLIFESFIFDIFSLKKECFNNYLIHCVSQDSNIMNESSNLCFQSAAIAPTNTPNVSFEQVFDFSFGDKANFCFKSQYEQTTSVKDKIMQKIKVFFIKI